MAEWSEREGRAAGGGEGEKGRERRNRKKIKTVTRRQ